LKGREKELASEKSSGKVVDQEVLRRRGLSSIAGKRKPKKKQECFLQVGSNMQKRRGRMISHGLRLKLRREYSAEHK